MDAILGLTWFLNYDIFRARLGLRKTSFLIREITTQMRETTAPIATDNQRKIPLLNGATDPFSYVANELRLVEETLVRAIHSREADLTDISGHLINGGGKRVRPMVTLLAYSAFGGKRKPILSISLRQSNSFTQQRCYTTISSTPRKLVEAKSPPSKNTD